MKTLFSRPLADVQISFILLDWSCRESFHIFDYLDNQTVARDRYELIWLEYFDRQPEEIEQRIGRGTASPDAWVVLEMPRDAYYHKHFIYNAGILLARGRIVVICDSDAMVGPSFVQSILTAFEQDEKIVLHLDEVRNIDRCHYPFDYPSVETFLAGTCINWRNGLTSGLLDGVDLIHDRNYGACFCALKDDLVAIGGADEHIDYLGHVCGPYDLTFRMVNAGMREIWLKDEFLYHTWHPGTDGQDNYLGPHDGRNVSSRSLNAMLTGRVTPYLESPAMARYRETGETEQSLALLEAVGRERTAGAWLMDDTKRYLSQGREAWYRGRFNEAVLCWERLAAVEASRTGEVLGWLGWGLLRLKRVAESIERFEEALALDGTNDWARCGLARALADAGRQDEAISCLDGILSGKPEELMVCLDALECRGGLLFDRGRYGDAAVDFRMLRRLHEQYDKTRLKQTAYWLGLCELRLENREAAAEAFTVAGAARDANPDVAARYLAGLFFLRRAVNRLRSLLRPVKRAVVGAVGQ